MSFSEQKCVSCDFVTSCVDVQCAYALDLDPLRVTGKEDFCSATRKGVEGVGTGHCTSVTASRMTNAYGASTLRVPHG